MQTSIEVRLTEVKPGEAIDNVVVDSGAKENPHTSGIVSHVQDYDITVRETKPQTGETNSINQRFRSEKETLFLTTNPGSFIKPWESDSQLVGNDEWCLTPIEGCPLDCSYCYLQDYLDSQVVRFFVNQDEMIRQIHCFLDDPPDEPPHFFSLGELSDGLFLEPITRTLENIWECFKGREEAHLEVRTKSHHVHTLLENVSPAKNIIFTWSLSPEEEARSEEMLTASLDQRLAAMEMMNNRGFSVAVRIDPVVVRDDWERKYQQLIQTLFDRLNPEELEFVIIGTFRFPGGFDRIMEQRFPQKSFLQEEFLKSVDSKMRYERSLRTNVYKALIEQLRSHGVEPDLCMEPPFIWEDCDLKPETFTKHA
ncbi:MAG: radical SAM protein [bacterium]